MSRISIRTKDDLPTELRPLWEKMQDYGAFDSSWINDEVIGRVRELNGLAEKRGQSPAQIRAEGYFPGRSRILASPPCPPSRLSNKS